MCTGSLKQDQMFRLSKGTGLRMDKIHYHFVKFIDDTKELSIQGQYWMQLEVGNQEHLWKTLRV